MIRLTKLLIILLCCSIVLCGCRTVKSVQSTTVDTLRIFRFYVDTVYKSEVKFDSIYIYDSVFAYNDDSVKYKVIYKYRDRFINRIDTFFKEQNRKDTILRIITNDTMQEAKLSPYQKLQLDTYPVIFFTLIALIMYIWYKSLKNDN